MSGIANHIRPLPFALFLLAMLCTAATGKIIYVDNDAIAEFDGTSWAHAYRCLQDAIADVLPGDEIRVAKGIYRPDRRFVGWGRPSGGSSGPIEASGDRDATFELINGVTFKGGYAGYGEPDPNARSMKFYETILSGDLNANDVDVNSPADLLTEPSREDNSYYVVTGSGNPVLDGFTVTGGTSAGLFNEYGTVQILNCTFSRNSSGGGIHNYRSNPSLTNCTFIQNCGSGIYNYRSYSDLTNCTFIENSAEYGGGIHNNESNPTLANCTFIANLAHYGGGMCNNNSDPILTDCIFTSNSGYNYGGGMYNTNGSYPILNNCVFNGNLAYNYGGGLSNNQSFPALTNCTFTANSVPRARGRGSAIACNSRGYTQGSTISLINCILWNDGNEIWNNDSSIFTVSYSNVRGGWHGEGNIDAEPLFIDPLGPDNIPGTEDDNLRLAPASPCIDSGDPGYVPGPDETDFDGNRRIIRGRIDMGAYEFQPIIYVDDNNRFETEQSSRTNILLEDGTELKPFNDIWKAIDVAKDGYAVLVKPGLYSKIDFKGKAITVAGIDGTAVIEGSLVVRGGNTDAVTFHTGEGPGSVLKNFVIRKSGMAISLNYGSRPTISNITIVDNDFGIAAYENSIPDISNCIFWNNKDGDLFQCQARYSCFEGGSSGEGNISGDPLFVDAANGDYHLKSEGWRWNTNSKTWTYDHVTSRCIDAGDPDSPLADEPMNVPRDLDNTYGVNQRINMGAFGGTAQASLPPSGWMLPDDLTAPEPNPAQWAPDGEPREAYGGPGEYDYLARMTALEAIDDSGTVEYLFECTTVPVYSSGWQSSNTYSVTVGRSGQNLLFRVKARDLYGNETAWSEELPAKLAPRQ